MCKIEVRSLNHAGGAQALKRTSLAYANARRDYRIFEQFYFKLLEHYADLFNLRFSSQSMRLTRRPSRSA